MSDPEHDTDFDVILDTTQDALRAYIAGLGVPPYDVDDIAQNTYIEFYRKQDARPENVQPIRWLKGIAKNLCMNHFRKQKNAKVNAHQAMVEYMADIAEAASSAPTFFRDDSLADCIAALSEKHQQILTMRYRAEKTSEAIAEALNTSASAIRVTLLRLRTALRDCLKTKGVQEA